MLDVSLKTPLGGTFNVEFYANVTDAQYVKWTGYATGRVRFPGLGTQGEGSLVITLKRKDQELAPLAIRNGVWQNLSSTSLGLLVAADLRELVDALNGGLPSASLCLAGKVLDGAFRVKGDGSWWDSAWDNLTLGGILKVQAVRSEISRDLGTGFLARLEASTLTLRNIGAHQKYTLPTLLEAHSTSAVVVELLNAWFT